MPDSFMPDVVVEVAFNAGYTTPAASRTWTDVSTYVELADRITIAFGRQDERSTADANVLTLTLDNSDGRFTAGRSASPYYPNVKIGRPIRVKVTPPGGTTSTRFVGFVDEWPVEWDGTDDYAFAQIRATSRLARLGLASRLRSMVETEIMLARPVAYYTMGDAAGSTQAVDSSGNDAVSLGLVGGGSPVVFGNATGPGTDDLTAVTFAGTSGQYLAANLAAQPIRAIRLALQLNATPTQPVAVARLYEAGTTNTLVEIDLSATGQLQVTRGSSTLTGPTITADSSVRDIAVRFPDASTVTLYVDGAAYDTAASGGTMGNAGRLELGSAPGMQTLNGSLSHVALFTTVPTATQFAEQARMMNVGAFGVVERTEQRLLRILGWAGVSSTEVTVETGVETMTYQKTTGQSVIDALRVAESTEAGVLFDDRDGNVRFHNRTHRYLKTPSANLDLVVQHVGSDYRPRIDRSALVNDVTIENQTSGARLRLIDTASCDEYGTVTATVTTAPSSDASYRPYADWLLASYAEPRMRVPSMTVDVVAHQGLTPSAQTLLGVTVGDVLAIPNAPFQADISNPSYFVEGYTETIGPEFYEVTFNLSPTFPTLNTFVLDSATRGLLDTHRLAF